MAWDTRQDCIDDIASSYADAHQERGLAGGHIISAKNLVDDITDGYAKGTCKQIIYALEHITTCILHFEIWNSSYDPEYGIPYFMTNFQSGPENGEFELTWKDIIQAWTGLSDPATMWTVTAIDQLRQSVFTKNPAIKWLENPFE